MKSSDKQPTRGKGVRKLTLKDQAPNCEFFVDLNLYDLKQLITENKAKKLIDIGCGHGRNKEIVESVGCEWIGVEPFEGGAHTVVGDAQNLPFQSNTFDIAIMDAVLEHIPEVEKAFSEVSRVLKPGGLFIGYSAFMECFHEISYSHLSFKAIEHYSKINGMTLNKISGGGRFGIDYHLSVLFYPIPFRIPRRVIAKTIRLILSLKSKIAYFGLRYKRKMPKYEAQKLSFQYYQIECLRQSTGFSYIITKNKTP